MLRLIKNYTPSHPEDKTRPDYLATVDTDPASPTYSQVIDNQRSAPRTKSILCEITLVYKLPILRFAHSHFPTNQVISRLHFPYLGDEIHHTG